MNVEQDFYTILGVPRNASEAEIRKAFRGRAKELHPDRKAASDHEADDSDEFRLLTEAYDTLKDPARRKAYDEELTLGRQIAAQGIEKSRYAFAKGLSIGLFIAFAAIGGKIYTDRAAFKFDAAKNQESLRGSKSLETSVLEARKSHPLRSERLTEAGKQGQTPDASAENVQSAGGSPEASKQVSGPTAPADAVSMASPAGQSGQEQAGTEDAGVKVTAAEPQVSRGASGFPPLSPFQGQTGLSIPATQTPRTETPPSAFAGEVLSLERALDAADSSIAAHRLVSLVNSATSVDVLVEAASLARKQETQDLISSRIVALRDSREKRKPTPGSEQDHAAPADAANAKVRFKPGSIEIAVGPVARETAVHLIPGNGLNESFSDCASCPEMVVIPAGQSIMGSRPESAGFRPEEAPAHRIAVRKPVAISKHWITAGDWRSCVEAGVCRPTISSFLAAGPEVPATRVSWFDAKTYVDWLSETTGRRYRLLSEAEWEYAAEAQGRAPAVMPLKPEPIGPKNPNDFSVFRYGARAKRFGTTRPNAWGLYGLPGNALEWVEDCWHANYVQAPSDTTPWLAGAGGDCAYRVVRGGADHGGELEERRAAARAREFADARAPTLGFRVAREVSQTARTALDPIGAGKSARGD